MTTEAGAFEARTRPLELLQQARATRPPDPATAIAKFKAFLLDNPIQGERRVGLKGLIKHGRE